MRLHDIHEDDLPYKIRMNLEKYRKSLNKNSIHRVDEESTRTGNQSASTGRKQIKRKIDTNINHVAVIGGDMVTVRNKDKKVNIKKGMEESLLDSISNKSKSNTRNKEKKDTSSSRKDLTISNGGDSLKALDDLMSVQQPKKNTNVNCIMRKKNIKFNPVRGRLKKKDKQPKLIIAPRDISADYKSMPQKLSETTEQNLANGRKVLQSRNKVKECFAPAELNNMISGEKPVLRNNFFGIS